MQFFTSRMAQCAGINLTLDDFTIIGERVPVLADVKPSGKYLMSELIEIGGIQPLMKMLLIVGLLHGMSRRVPAKQWLKTLPMSSHILNHKTLSRIRKPSEKRQSS